LLRQKLEVIERFETVDYGALKALGFEAEDDIKLSATGESDT
jgi:hypothetical protein